MRHRSTALAALVLTTALLAAACGSDGGAAPATPGSVVPPATSSPDLEPGATPGGAAPTTGAATPGGGAPTDGPASEAPVIDAAWATAELTDVATGEAFRIADLAGRTVIIETMAIWCTNCRVQQGDVYAALEELDPDRVAYVLLDVDPNETAAALAEYRERNGFTGTYAIAGRDVARALAADFGDQVLNPPSTPMIVIGSDGQVTFADFGHKSPAEVVALAREHGA